MFNKFDTDKSGFIDDSEFAKLAFSLGYALSDEEVTLAVKVLDTDGTGHISLQEFKKWCTLMRKASPRLTCVAHTCLVQQALICVACLLAC